MVGIPLVLNCVLLVVFVLAGVLQAKRLKARVPDIKLETVLKEARLLYGLIPLVLVPITATVILRIRPSVIWDLPLWLQYAFTALNWGTVLAIFAFIFSLAVMISYKTRHPEHHKIIGAAYSRLFSAHPLSPEP